MAKAHSQYAEAILLFGFRSIRVQEVHKRPKIIF